MLHRDDAANNVRNSIIQLNLSTLCQISWF